VPVAPTKVTVPTVEQYVSELAAQLLISPQPECLLCYVLRMLQQFHCDTTLRFATGWRDQRLPAAHALERRLNNRGGFCDCEIFLNGWTVADEYCLVDPLTGELEAPEVMPGCLGVGPRSSQPCSLWAPRRRGT
jgi:hypothetical protein